MNKSDQTDVVISVKMNCAVSSLMGENRFGCISCVPPTAARLLLKSNGCLPSLQTGTVYGLDVKTELGPIS